MTKRRIKGRFARAGVAVAVSAAAATVRGVVRGRSRGQVQVVAGPPRVTDNRLDRPTFPAPPPGPPPRIVVVGRRPRTVDKQPSGRARAIVRNIGTTVGIQFANLVTGALVARLLGPYGRGLLAAITNVSSSAAAVGDAGGPTAYAYQTAKTPERTRQLIRNVYAIVGVQSTVITLGGSVAMLVVMHQDGHWKYVGIAFLVLFVPLNLLSRYFASIYQGQHEFGRFNAILLALALSYVGAIVVFFSLSINSLYAVLLATMGSAVIAVAVSMRWLKYAAGSPGLRFDKRLARETFRYGIRAHLGNLSPIDTLQVDIAFVIAFLGPREAGLYTVGSSAAAVVRQVGIAIGLAALPSVASTPAGEAGRRITGLFFRIVVVTSFIGAVIIWVAAGTLVPLIYGSRFGGAVEVVRLLVIAAAAAAIRQVLNDSMRGAGHPLYGSIAEFASWIVLCAALPFMVPAYGLTGAALSVGGAYLLALAVIFTLTVRSGMPARDLLLPTRADFEMLQRRVAAATARFSR